MDIHIHHTGISVGKPTFVVESKGKREAAVSLTPPCETSVPGRPSSNLQQDLRWYLEDFLEVPTGAYIELSERILQETKRWGQECFQTLFQRQAYVWYQQALDDGLDRLRLTISSDDPLVLAWPWEALHCERGYLAHHCRIERQMRQHNDEHPLAPDLPRDCLNVLLVIARPGGVEDVGFQSVSRPLVDLAVKRQADLRVDVLRPPTFDILRTVLHERRNFYHVIHFDGHGGYGMLDRETMGGGAATPFALQGARGVLVFERPEGGGDPIPSDTLSALLAEANIPVMVMNACQSATVDEHAEDAFASVALSLVNAGVRSVVAMGYTLYVSGAREFVPTFYERLLENRDVAEATRAGRQRMLRNKGRLCLLGQHPLEDWMVPVLYQRYETVLPQREASPDPCHESQQATLDIPEEAMEQGDYGFIGRDSMIRLLEEACLRQPQGAILVHGMAGVGKTTLARGFLRWLHDTHWSGAGLLWFSFEGIRSFEFIVNRLMDMLGGTKAMAAPLEDKVDFLVRAFREYPFIMVWDNFESVSGIDGTEVSANLAESDRALVKHFIQMLLGGASKIIITSRSPEEWLAVKECFRLPLGGLRGEELWAYCDAILRDHGKKADRHDPRFRELVTELDGHPLALQAVLPLLDSTPAGEVLDSLLAAMDEKERDPALRRLQAALEMVGKSMPEEFTPFLELLGLHSGYADLIYVAEMVGHGTIPQGLVDCMMRLETAGLCNIVKKYLYHFHPTLNIYLRKNYPASEEKRRRFIDFMADYAHFFALKDLHEQRIHFFYFEQNFYNALREAEFLTMINERTLLLQSLGFYSLNCRNYAISAKLFETLGELSAETNNYAVAASAYFQLGTIALEFRDFDTAEERYNMCLAIQEEHGEELGAAAAYHQLGRVCQERHDFALAERYYRKSLVIHKRYGDEPNTAMTCHHLGVVAHLCRDFPTAEKWLTMALKLNVKNNTESGIAMNKHQLGMVAQERGDFVLAIKMYMDSLKVKLKHNNERGAAATYHQLGRIYDCLGKFDVAETWYKKSLAIKEKFGDKLGAARTYRQLGRIAQEHNDFSTAEEWFKRALAIEEKHGSDYDAD